MFTNWELVIYTVPQVATALGERLRVGTIHTGAGVWLGQSEESATVTIVAADPTELERVLDTATILAERLDENYLLATVREVSAALIATDTRERFPLVDSVLAVSA